MISLEDFKYGGTNVTAFRLVDPDRDEVRQVRRKQQQPEEILPCSYTLHQQLSSVIPGDPRLELRRGPLRRKAAAAGGLRDLLIHERECL